MVPRVDSATIGLRLALIRAVPDSAVPPDILLGFLLRLMSTKLSKRRMRKVALVKEETKLEAESSNSSLENSGVKAAVDAWLYGMMRKHEQLESSYGAKDHEYHHNVRGGPFIAERGSWEDEMGSLLHAVERESGAEGKSEPSQRRRICCQYLLEAFREGKFGRITLDETVRSTPSPVADKSQRLAARHEANRGDEKASRYKRDHEHELATLDWSDESAWRRADAPS